MELDTFIRKVKEDILKDSREYLMAYKIIVDVILSVLIPLLLKERFVYTVNLPLVEKLAVVRLVDDIRLFGEEKARERFEEVMQYISDPQKMFDEVYDDFMRLIRPARIT